MTLTWTYKLYSKCTGHHSAVCLYGLQGTENDINTLEVDFTNHYTNRSGAQYLLNNFTNENQNGKIYDSAKKTASLNFNNIDGATTQTKTWYLLFTHVIASAGGKTGLEKYVPVVPQTGTADEERDSGKKCSGMR